MTKRPSREILEQSTSIDRGSYEPAYVQLVNSLRHSMAAGLLRPGDQLPSEAQLCSRYEVSPMTVRRAINILVDQGIVVTEQGRGTFVREHPDNAHLTRVRQEQLKGLMDGVIGKALSQGYPIDEVRSAFEAQLARWSRQK